MEHTRVGRLVISRDLQPGTPAHDRAMRLAARVAADRTEALSGGQIDALFRELRGRGLHRAGRAGVNPADRIMVLGPMRWDRPGGLFPGYDWAETRSGRYQWREHGVICQTAVEIQTIFGCLFDCSYCPYTRFVHVTCDLEAFVERVSQRLSSGQRLYKLNNRSDTLCFEPEYGLSRMLVERFAEANGPQLMLYSKSDNVSHLLELDHRGATIACFTLSSPKTARLLEPSAPSFEARLDAAARCAEAGYPVRFRFSPVLPLVGWRSEVEDMVARMAERVRPELVTLWTLSMIDAEELSEVVAPDDLEPRAWETVRLHAQAMAGLKGAPFPEGLRAEIYGVFADAIAAHSPTTRVALCLETEPVIERLRPRLAIRRNAQVCNCGPGCTSDAVASAPAAGDPHPRRALRRKKPTAKPRLPTAVAARKRRDR